MLDMKLGVGVNHLPFLDFMSRSEKIDDVIAALIEYKSNGTDPNFVLDEVLDYYGLDIMKLTDSECEYIKAKVNNG